MWCLSRLQGWQTLDLASPSVWLALENANQQQHQKQSAFVKLVSALVMHSTSISPPYTQQPEISDIKAVGAGDN